MPEPDVTTLMMAGMIILAGHLVKGVTGFGSALFAVPLLLLIMDVKVVTPVFLLFDLTSGALLVASNWRSIDRRLLFLLMSGMVLGTTVGTWMLVSFSHQVLKRILGILVFGWALTMLLGREPAPHSPARPLGTTLAPLSGFLGGALGAAFSVNGPPIIIYLSHVLHEKRTFRATLCGVFFADACYKTVLFVSNDLLNLETLRLAVLWAPFVVVGVAAGSWVQQYLDQRVFRKIVAGILTVTGLLLLA